MADDRYKWLDGEAAERLLRGLPVNARSAAEAGAGGTEGSGGGSADPERSGEGCGEDFGEDRRGARLAAALGQLAARHAPSAPPDEQHGGHTGTPSAELPGEAAAVEAFRASSAGVLRSAAAGVPDAADLGAVSGTSGRCSGRPRTGGRRPSLMGRPMRAGFAMALAGCAIGGVAVAAGAGVLPPFGGDAPVTQVSPAHSGGAQDEGPRGDVRVSPGDGGSADPGEDGEHEKHRDGTSTPPGSSGTGSSTGPRPSTSSPSRGDGGAGDALSESDKRKLAAALCPAHESGKLSADERQRLERAAGGRKAVDLFCGRHGGKLTGGASDTGKGGAAGGSGSGGDEGGAGDAGGAAEGVTGGSGSGGDEGAGNEEGDGTSDREAAPETTVDSTDPAGTATSGETNTPGTEGASASPETSPSASAERTTDPVTQRTPGS